MTVATPRKYPGRAGTVERPVREVSVSLTCGDTLTFPAPLPGVGDVIWCRKCTENTHVIDSRFTGRMWSA